MERIVSIRLNRPCWRPWRLLRARASIRRTRWPTITSNRPSARASCCMLLFPSDSPSRWFCKDNRIKWCWIKWAHALRSADSRIPARSCLGEQAVDVLANDFIALAGFFSETGAIDDLNLAVMRVDQPRGMQFPDHPRNRGSLHAEHFAQELLREGNDVALRPVAGLEQPPAEPRGDVVQTIACRRLLDLPECQFTISRDHRPDPGTAAGRGLELGKRDVQGGPRNLDQGADEGDPGAQTGREPDRPLMPHRADLERGILGHGHDERDQAALREIDPVHHLPRVFQGLALLDRDLPQMPAQQRQVGLRQRGEQPIAGSLHIASPARDRFTLSRRTGRNCRIGDRPGLRRGYIPHGCRRSKREAVMHRSEPKFCRDQAERLLKLAGACEDTKVRDDLCVMANEWLKRAEAKEKQDRDLPKTA